MRLEQLRISDPTRACVLPAIAVHRSQRHTITADAVLPCPSLSVLCSKPSDVDMFRFVVPSTISRVTVTVQLRPVAPWGTQVLRSNLHSNVVVRRGSSQILQANGFNVGPFTTSRQQSGTFFVSVAPTGVVGEYTAYGSRGQYELTVTYQAA